MKLRLLVTCVVVSVVAAFGVLLNRPQASVAVARGPEVAVYSDGFALVTERRTFSLQQGLNTVRLVDIPRGIDPSSVHVRSLTDPEGTLVLEQTFTRGVEDAPSLLERYVGREVLVTTRDGSTYVGTLLAAGGDVILQRSGGDLVVLRGDEVQRFELTTLPEDLILRPTLEWIVQASRSGPQQFELAYLTEGMRWQAFYSVLVAADDEAVDLRGWFSLENQTGANFVDAHVKLVAGSVRREAAGPVLRAAKAVPEMTAGPTVTEQPFFEYHVYTVQQPVTLLHDRTKQIQFVAAPGLEARKQYILRFLDVSYTGQPLLDPEFATKVTARPTVFIEVKTGEGTPVNTALPAGTVRVYKEDPDGIPLFVGEARIDHTPAGEVLKLPVGEAFDIVGERTQTDFTRLGEDALEESYAIEIRNHKAEPVTVRVVEPMFRSATWEIVKASQEYTKADAYTVHFDVEVPAEGASRVTYTVRYRW